MIIGESVTTQYGSVMLNEMANYIKRMVKDVLGESKGYGRPTKETWCWNKEVQAAIRLKRESDRSLLRCRGNATYENYKVTKREGKNVV